MMHFIHSKFVTEIICLFCSDRLKALLKNFVAGNDAQFE